MDLRDYSTSLWSQPVRSVRLEREFAARRSKKAHEPHLNCRQDAVKGDVERLTVLCQKPSDQRSPEDVGVIRALVTSLCPFFNMWPGVLQEELARMLATEVLVERESVLSRGLVPTKLFIILSGKLHVLAHDSSTAMDVRSPEDKRQTSSAGGGSARVMAVLKRGDTCGEAVLLGSAASHADVVVGSKGAVLLSLALPDFLQAFKEILGLRQQDRLEFLRCHPLFQGISLGELDLLAEQLSPAYLAARSLMLPRPPNETSRTYLIAEGLVVVKRVSGASGGRQGFYARAMAAAASLPDDDGGVSQVYDSDTLSVLPASAVVGAGLGPGLAAVAITSVKAYWLPSAKQAGLPPRIKQLLDSADVFWSAYQCGRQKGLNHMDHARRKPSYGAYTYKVGDMVMSSVVGPSSHTPQLDHSQTTASSPGHAAVHAQEGKAVDASVPDETLVDESRQHLSSRGFMHTPSSPPGTQGLSPRGCRMLVPLQDPHKSNQDPTASSQLAAKRQATLHALSAQQVLAVMDAQVHRDPQTGLMTSNIEKAAGAASLQSSAALRTTGAHRGTRPNRHNQPGSLQPPAGSPGNTAGRAQSPQPPLGMLHPTQATWPKVTGSRRVPVQTEPPKHQSVPPQFQQRHSTIHRQAVLASLVRPPTRDPYGYDDDNSDGEEEGIKGGHRQPSRRLSGDPRSRLSRTASRGSHRSASFSTPSQSFHHPGLAGVSGTDHATLSSADLVEGMFLPPSALDHGMSPPSSSQSDTHPLPSMSSSPSPPSSAPSASQHASQPPAWQRASEPASVPLDDVHAAPPHSELAPQAGALNATMRASPSARVSEQQPRPSSHHSITPPAAFAQERTAKDLQDVHPHHHHNQAQPSSSSQHASSAEGQQPPPPKQTALGDFTGSGPAKPGGIGVPASVVLGYEKMDPLQWATLSSHAPMLPRHELVLGARPFRGPGLAVRTSPSSAADGLLPAPKW